MAEPAASPTASAEALPELHGSGACCARWRPRTPTDCVRFAGSGEVADFWGPLEDDFPLDDEPTARRYSILVEGELAGMIQFSEENEPDYRHVRFHSPVADYAGADDVLHLLALISEVLEDLRPGSQLLGASGVGTPFAARVGEHSVDGLLHEVSGGGGRIAELTLLLRPHAGVREAMRRMGELLAEAPLPSAR